VRAELADAIAAIRGANYLPSNAVNPTQMWLDFDATTIVNGCTVRPPTQP